MSRRTAAPRRPTHPFTAEPGMTDWRDNPLCGQPGCGQPETHPAHKLPETDPAVAAMEARRLGEHPDREDT